MYNDHLESIESNGNCSRRIAIMPALTLATSPERGSSLWLLL